MKKKVSKVVAKGKVNKKKTLNKKKEKKKEIKKGLGKDAGPKFLDELFAKYADPTGIINPEGLQKISSDLGLDMNKDVLYIYCIYNRLRSLLSFLFARVKHMEKLQRKDLLKELKN